MPGNRFSQATAAQVPSINLSRSVFDRSHSIKDTFIFDRLVPIYVDEVVPGDTISLDMNAFGRLATQKVPILDNLYLDYFFFFVPNRLVWEHWEEFCGARKPNPDSTIDYTVPIVTTDGTVNAVGSLYDKMGIPTGINNLEINALPLRAYNLIYNEWFRDQNLQDSITVDVDDGPDTLGNYLLRQRNKRHDYFTSCLVAPQKGDDVLIPASIVSDGTQPTLTGGGLTNAGMLVEITTSKLSMSGVATGTGSVVFGNNTGLEVGPTSTINALREAFQIQALLELDNRSGTRYVEILKAHYGVVSPDFRLQRPEYLGGGSTRFNIHPVSQTSPTSGSNAQGALAAFGTVSTMGENIGFSKSFVEHGYVIGLVCARADITYQQGLHRMWSRQTRYDFYWPMLQQIGDQAVLVKELYAQGTANDDVVFGYQERYAEYKYKPSEIHGEFRSTYTTPLDMWHMAEEFGSQPALNETWIEQETPIERSIAVTNAIHILFDAWLQVKHARPMMSFSVPASLGRF